MKNILILFISLFTLLFTIVNISFADEIRLEQIRNKSVKLKVTGEGIYPDDLSMNLPMKRKIAKRLASLDAYRTLAEYIHGIKISSNTTIKDFILQNDEIEIKISAVVKGGIITDVRYGEEVAKVDIEIILGKDFYNSINMYLK